MSATLQAQVLGLAGAPSAAIAIQGSIKAQLIGVDLAAFSPGDPSAEAVVRRDPGAAQATLTFTKSGQSLPLPSDLAKALVGQTYGSASIAVEILGSDADGAIAASLRRVGAAAGSTEAGPAADASAASGAAKFSAAAQALSHAASIGLESPSQWANLVSVLLPALPPEQARSLAAFAAASSAAGLPDASAGSQASGAMAQSLADIVPGAGVGFERSVADMSTRGASEQDRMAGQIGRFAQTAGAAAADASQWVAQQASAASSAEVLWQGQAWKGAPAWLAVGSSESPTENAREVYSRLSQKPQDSLAWIRMRVDPAGIGPIDLWAAILGGGRCHARLRAPRSAKAAMNAAQSAFSRALEGARVDLRVDYASEGEEP